MPFVNERIPEEDKIRLNLNELIRSPAPSHHCIYPSRWTVDRARNAFLIETMAGKEGQRSRAYFAFVWKDQIVKIELDRNYQSDNDSTWTRKYIAIPPALEGERQIIIDLLKEALCAYGFSGEDVPRPGRNVHFDF